MNRYANQQSAMAACEEEISGLPIATSDSVVCPKPRRIGFLNPSINDQIRPSRCRLGLAEIADSKEAMEILDIILTKGSYSTPKLNNQVASSPPFFSGSPPSRASNPLIQDSYFGNDKCNLLQQAAVTPTSPSASAHKGSSSACKGGSCARAKLGLKLAAVRIEGFDCLSRDRRSISAVA